MIQENVYTKSLTKEFKEENISPHPSPLQLLIWLWNLWGHVDLFIFYSRNIGVNGLLYFCFASEFKRLQTNRYDQWAL